MKYLLLLAALGAGMWRPSLAQSNDRPMDGVAAVVGTHSILFSDLAREMTTLPVTDSLALAQQQCLVADMLVQQKLLLIQAEEDSITIDPKTLSAEINRRMAYFIQQFGGVEALEQFYGKPLPAIKEEMRDPLRELMKVERIRDKIVKNVYVTPSEVKAFFRKIPPDSLPYFNMQVKVAHLVRKPRPLPEDQQRAYEKAKEIRRRILQGESFENLAILYSDDIASATKGGDLGFVPASDLDPAYANVARGLLIDSISDVVKTQFGYHIIRLKGRRGDALHTQHILIRPRITDEAVQHTIHQLDSLRQEIMAGHISFEEAAQKYSEDIHTKNNGGLLFNPQTSKPYWFIDELDLGTFAVIDTMTPGQISAPVPYRQGADSRAYRLVHLIDKIPPHRADLQKDWEHIAEMALEQKKQAALQRWVENKARITLIKIMPPLHYCKNLDKYQTHDHPNRP